MSFFTRFIHYFIFTCFLGKITQRHFVEARLHGLLPHVARGPAPAPQLRPVVRQRPRLHLPQAHHGQDPVHVLLRLQPAADVRARLVDGRAQPQHVLHVAGPPARSGARGRPASRVRPGGRPEDRARVVRLVEEQGWTTLLICFLLPCLTNDRRPNTQWGNHDFMSSRQISKYDSLLNE